MLDGGVCYLMNIDKPEPAVSICCEQPPFDGHLVIAVKNMVDGMDSILFRALRAHEFQKCLTTGDLAIRSIVNELSIQQVSKRRIITSI